MELLPFVPHAIVQAAFLQTALMLSKGQNFGMSSPDAIDGL